MATRGRKPTPTAIKELEGNPGKRPLNATEPKPEKKAPPCPKWLEPEAKKEWHRLSKQLEQIGVLTEVDQAAFASYCQAYARWKEAEEFMTQHGTITKTPSGYWQQVPQVSIYPVIYGLEDREDWNSEKVWYKANPSLGYTIQIDRVRDAHREALTNPAEENVFRQLRLDQWVGSAVAWIPEHIYDKGNTPIDLDALKGRECYCGLDLSSTSDITAFVMVFPPRNETEKYIVVPHSWLPKETLDLRVRRDHVPYDVWERQGLFHVTNGAG